MTRPLPLSEVLASPTAETVTDGMRTVARFVLATGAPVLISKVGVAYRKTRASSVLNGKRIGRRYALAMRAVTATRRAR